MAINFNIMSSTNTYTAIITPFKNDKLDEIALEKIIEFQIKNGVDGIVPCGTTGESPTLSYEEHNRVIALSIEIVNKRIKVMAGTGSNSTSEAVIFTRYAKEIGADSCLIACPYYNKPTKAGLLAHFQELSKCNIPLIVYNIPGRSVIDINNETMTELSKIENVMGVKDATGDLSRVANLRKTITKQDFLYLSGEDALAVGYNSMGGNGIISVTSNVSPKLVSEMQKFCMNNQYDKAFEIQQKLINLHDTMFCETNPIPVKYAMHLMGFCENEIRLPLVEPTKTSKERIKEELKTLSLI